MTPQHREVFRFCDISPCQFEMSRSRPGPRKPWLARMRRSSTSLRKASLQNDYRRLDGSSVLVQLAIARADRTLRVARRIILMRCFETHHAWTQMDTAGHVPTC